MPAGDAQRVWFPEMAERLASGWRADMSLEALIELRDELDAMLTCIRSERSIRTPVFTCSRCGSTGPGAAPHVSVRALILALARFGIATAEVSKALEKDWAAYRKRTGLDICGKAPAAPVRGCAHAGFTYHALSATRCDS